jgi:hypothetical protein
VKFKFAKTLENAQKLHFLPQNRLLISFSDSSQRGISFGIVLDNIYLNNGGLRAAIKIQLIFMPKWV